MKVRAIAVGLLALVVLGTACAERREGWQLSGGRTFVPGGPYRMVRYGDRMPAHQATLTWTQDGRPRSSFEPDEQAQYIFNGEAVGTGSAGFGEVLDRLRALPDGSTVLVYPLLDWTNSMAFQGVYPFDREWAALDAVTAERRLTLAFCDVRLLER